MSKVLRVLGASVLALILLALLAAFLLPARWSVSRSVLIQAQPSAIYPLVASFRKGWSQWSSFEREDPGIQFLYAGPESGAGALRSWTSRKMGDGSQQILKADPREGIEFELLMPAYEVRLQGSIRFQPEGGATRVSWTDQGDAGRNPMRRIFGALMDRMMGPTLEDSLNNLKVLAEASSKKR